MTDQQQKFLLQLKQYTALLNTSTQVLQRSYNICTQIGMKEKYEAAELDAFEALTARFARTSDILTQKVLRIIFLVLQETPQTFIDRANMAEKFSIVEQAQNLLLTRELRNEIAHDYAELNLTALFKRTLEFTPLLLKTIASTNTYIAKKFSL
jgi:hypothetical protein